MHSIHGCMIPVGMMPDTEGSNAGRPLADIYVANSSAVLHQAPLEPSSHQFTDLINDYGESEGLIITSAKAAKHLFPDNNAIQQCAKTMLQSAKFTSEDWGKFFEALIYEKIPITSVFAKNIQHWSQHIHPVQLENVLKIYYKLGWVINKTTDRNIKMGALEFLNGFEELGNTNTNMARSAWHDGFIMMCAMAAAVGQMKASIEDIHSHIKKFTLAKLPENPPEEPDEKSRLLACQILKKMTEQAVPPESISLSWKLTGPQKQLINQQIKQYVAQYLPPGSAQIHYHTLPATYENEACTQVEIKSAFAGIPLTFPPERTCEERIDIALSILDFMQQLTKKHKIYYLHPTFFEKDRESNHYRLTLKAVILQAVTAIDCNVLRDNFQDDESRDYFDKRQWCISGLTEQSAMYSMSHVLLNIFSNHKKLLIPAIHNSMEDFMRFNKIISLMQASPENRPRTFEPVRRQILEFKQLHSHQSEDRDTLALQNLNAEELVINGGTFQQDFTLPEIHELRNCLLKMLNSTDFNAVDIEYFVRMLVAYNVSFKLLFPGDLSLWNGYIIGAQLRCFIHAIFEYCRSARQSAESSEVTHLTKIITDLRSLKKHNSQWINNDLLDIAEKLLREEVPLESPDVKWKIFLLCDNYIKTREFNIDKNNHPTARATLSAMKPTRTIINLKLRLNIAGISTLRRQVESYFYRNQPTLSARVMFGEKNVFVTLNSIRIATENISSHIECVNYTQRQPPLFSSTRSASERWQLAIDFIAFFSQLEVQYKNNAAEIPRFSYLYLAPDDLYYDEERKKFHLSLEGFIRLSCHHLTDYPELHRSHPESVYSRDEIKNIVNMLSLIFKDSHREYSTELTHTAEIEKLIATWRNDSDATGSVILLYEQLRALKARIENHIATARIDTLLYSRLLFP